MNLSDSHFIKNLLHFLILWIKFVLGHEVVCKSYPKLRSQACPVITSRLELYKQMEVLYKQMDKKYAK